MNRSISELRKLVWRKAHSGAHDENRRINSHAKARPSGPLPSIHCTKWTDHLIEAKDGKFSDCFRI